MNERKGKYATYKRGRIDVKLFLEAIKEAQIPAGEIKEAQTKDKPEGHLETEKTETEAPETEVISFDTEDVITTSNGTDVLNPFDNGNG